MHRATSWLERLTSSGKDCANDDALACVVETHDLALDNIPVSAKIENGELEWDSSLKAPAMVRVMCRIKTCSLGGGYVANPKGRTDDAGDGCG